MADLGNTSVFSQTDGSNGSGTMPSWLGSAAPSTLDDAGRALQGAVTREWNWRNPTITAGGTADVKTLTYSVDPAAYYNGQRFAFIANTTNTTTVTLNVNSLGAKTIKKLVSGTATNLAAGDLVSGNIYEVAYNTAGNCFYLISEAASITGTSNTFTASQVIEVTDNTNAALRVTQLGTADALRVEDSANPDSTPFIVTATGNVGIGEAAPSYLLDVVDAAAATVARVRNGSSGGTPSTTHSEFTVESADSNMGIQLLGTNTSNQRILFGDAAANSQGQIEYNHSSDYMAFYTAGAEKTRITSGGILLHGASATLNTASSTDTGFQVNSTGQSFFMASALAAVNVSRQTDDGNLMNFYQGGTVEGSISVSGTTISYNAFSGSHWSQLADGSRPEILVGTVVETIDQKCVWPGEDNDQLAKFKISDTPASKCVYGVFMAWDNDDDETNDAFITSLGAYLVRVAAGVTVQNGDLLESNGDGCARVQSDDIIRSSTIGKVTCNIPTATYPDGSYTVPCVLYCG